MESYPKLSQSVRVKSLLYGCDHLDRGQLAALGAAEAIWSPNAEILASRASAGADDCRRAMRDKEGLFRDLGFPARRQCFLDSRGSLFGDGFGHGESVRLGEQKRFADDVHEFWRLWIG